MHSENWVKTISVIAEQGHCVILCFLLAFVLMKKKSPISCGLAKPRSLVLESLPRWVLAMFLKSSLAGSSATRCWMCRQEGRRGKRVSDEVDYECIEA